MQNVLHLEKVSDGPDHAGSRVVLLKLYVSMVLLLYCPANGLEPNMVRVGTSLILRPETLYYICSNGFYTSLKSTGFLICESRCMVYHSQAGYRQRDLQAGRAGLLLHRPAVGVKSSSSLIYHINL